ncbi:metal-dependent hydrolase family protein [Sandarakinorhabdus limnophila]|uniref:metal-dependent hydrolase family protein n=1 Tax=Sandarakinorhabdus limnophila TaxID=210512 RepID=UPI0026EBC688|nr:amidohydrolase family protein [Sandarakinorhabdus limnophila]
MRTTLIAALLLASPAAAETVAKDVIAIRAGRVITDAAKPALGPSTIIVTDGRITAINPASAPIPSGARAIDQSSRTLSPGLIDSHVHLTGDPGTPFWREAVDSAELSVAYGLKNARITAKAGFTTVRDLGSARLSGFAVRDAINSGMFPGPRILAAGASLSIVGGHGDVSGFAPVVNDALDQGNTCTGAVECAARVREASQRGADVIKFTATGGVLSQQGRGLDQHFTDDEMRAIVTTAHSLGLKVAARAHGPRGIEAAARAGVDSVEHGSFTDEAGAKALAAHKGWLVPTLLPFRATAERLGSGAYTPVVEAKVRAILERRGKQIIAARAAGARIAFGTDAGVFEHGRNGQEASDMVEFGGMTAREVLISATTGAAELLGLSAETGTLEPGKAADIIATDGDPTADAKQLAQVKWVMARGKVID